MTRKRKYRISAVSMSMYTQKFGVYDSFLKLWLVSKDDERDTRNAFLPLDKSETLYEAMRIQTGLPIEDERTLKGVVAEFDVNEETGEVVSVKGGDVEVAFVEPQLG